MNLLTLADYERAARARLPREVWDFVAGGALDERTLAANLEAFDRVRILPRILTGAGVADPATRLFGRAWAAPIAVAPCAYHALAHPDAEPASVRAAGEAGLPLVLSTFSSSTFKEVQAAAADAGTVLWQQLYAFRDRAVTEQLVRDAQDAGIEALVLSVDAPHLGRRLRDLRNGFRVPEAIRAANLTFAQGPDPASPADHARAAHDPDLDWTVLERLRAISDLPILLKGVLSAGDAARAVEAGADGVIVSNHGGRQLDGVPATLEALPAVAAAVARRVPVLLDGGVRRGVDVLAALALGADGVLVGRPVLHGLAVDGSAGVRDVLTLLTEDLREAMTLAGVARVADAIATADNRPDALIDLQLLHPLPLPAVTRSLISPPTLPLRRSALHASLSDPNLETMAFLNEITDRHPDAVSFAPGRPYEGFFEVEDVFVAMRSYLERLEASGRTPRTALYQYGPSAGLIRDLIAQSLRVDESMDVAPESIVVTVGAQEGMILALRALFAEPEDVLLVCTPCYVGIIGAAKLLDIRVITVPERPDGLDPADVEHAIAEARGQGLRPRGLYLVPDHSNPSGSTLSLPDRERLLAIAREHAVPILEDSPYRLVSPGERLPTLKAVELARAPRDRVVLHIGSFAKSVFPGARVGYVVADQPVEGAGLLADELAKIKSMVTVNTPTLSQAAVGGMLLACDGRLSAINQRAAELYGGNLRVLLNELRAHFPPGPGAPTWNEPSGGFFLKVGVPFAADNAALARSAERHGVLWTPMAYFYPDGGGERELRLSFSALTPERIREGVARLARFITAETG